MTISWDRLRIFHIVAESRSLKHAAEILEISQSSVSRQISALEKDIGARLFYRCYRGLVLTEEGELLFHAAHDVTMRLSSIESRIQPKNAKPVGVFRITVPFFLGSSWLTEQMPEFLDLYPDIQVQLILTNEEFDFSIRQSDCAICLQRPQEQNLLQRRLFKLDFHLYASKGYLEKFGYPNAIADLKNHRIITFGIPVSSYLADLNWLEKVGDFEGEQRIATLRINDMSSIKKAIETDAGIGLLPDYMVDSGSLEQILSTASLPSFETYFVYAESMKNNPKFNVFRDFLFMKAKQFSH